MPEYTEDPGDEFNYDDDWDESIDLTQPGGGTSVSYGNQEAVLVGLVPWNKQRSCARYFLGYSWADGDAPYRLYREPPQPHPVWPQLRAASVSFAGLAPLSNPLNPAGETFVPSPFVGAAGGDLYYAGYHYALTTVRYRNFGRMRFLPDSDVPSYLFEYTRYCRFTNDVMVEALSADGISQLVFREGNGSGGGTGPTANVTAFPAPVAELLAKSSFCVVWHNVPHDYVSSDEDALVPDKVVKRLGCVNDATFLGFPTGSVLFQAMKAEEVLFPVVSDAPEDLPLTGWNLSLFFSVFDNQDLKGVPGSGYVGHRTFPWRNDGKWYYASRSDPAREMLPLADLKKVFQHVSAP